MGLFFYAQKQGGEYMIDIPQGLLYALSQDEKVRKEKDRKKDEKNQQNYGN